MRTWMIKLGALLFVTCILGCKAPIQLTIVTITEHFEQNFDFSDIPKEEQVEFIGDMLQTKLVLGKFQHHINSEEGEIINKALLEKNDVVVSDGIVTISLSLLPYKRKPKRFDISGVGTYDILNSDNDEVYFTSTFHMTGCKNCDDINRLSENDSFVLKVTFTQIAINQFDYEKSAGKRYRHVPMVDNKKEDIEIHIDLIKQERFGKKCFSINYGEKAAPHKHSVFFKNKPIGYIRITPPADLSSRVIDLGHMKMLIRKYKRMTP